jgi:hypothetical protein
MFTFFDLKPLRILLICCLVGAPIVVSAQEAEPPLFVQVRTTYINPGMQAKYVEFINRLNAARVKAGVERGTLVTRTRTGRSGYVSVTLYDSYAELQTGADSLVSDDEWADMMGLIADSVRGGTVQTFFTRQDLGRQGAINVNEAEAYLTILVDIKPGTNQAYEEAMHKLVEATEKVAPDVGWIAYGPDMSSANTYRFVIPWTWATIDQPGMSIPERYIRAFGETQGMKWLDQLNEPVESAENYMTVGVPELSYFPDQE